MSNRMAWAICWNTGILAPDSEPVWRVTGKVQGRMV
jgi:hypothetical protein